jgi:hypothetical protein
MPKKVEATFVATITLNTWSKAGGWLAIVSAQRPAGESVNSMQPAEGVSEYTAWKNASAAKRWVKEQVLKHTPRKSVKMVATGSVDAKGKPTAFAGSLTFKVDNDFTFTK